MSGTDDDPVLSVHGGRGGTQAWLDDLERMAWALRHAGNGLSAIAVQVLAAARDGALLVTALASPATAVGAETAVLGAALGPDGAVSGALRLELLGGGVEGAVRAYRAVDASVSGLLHGLDLMAGRVAGRVVGATALLVVPFAVTSLPTALLTSGAGGVGGRGGDGIGGIGGTGGTAGSAGGLPRAGAMLARSWVLGQGERLLALAGRHTGIVEHLMDAAPGFLAGLRDPLAPGPIAFGSVAGTGIGWAVDLGTISPRDPREASAMISGLAQVSPWLREPATVRTQAGPPLQVATVTGLADLLARVGSASPGAAQPDGTQTPPGTVRVERVTHADGSRAWLVEIPGTHVWSPVAGTDPFDLTSDVRTLGGRTSAVGVAVTQALRTSGARPEEPVLLAGHSLGGMVAAELAADPAVRAQFRITHVVTAGSPVALAPIPPSVQVLSLEHADDLVPRLDGAANPDRPQWLTVDRRVTMPMPGQDDAQPTPAYTHAVQTYVGTAALVDASTDPSLVDFRGSLAPFTGGPGTSTTAWFVRAERVVTS